MEPKWPLMPYEEYKNRWEKARKLMEKQGIEALLINGWENKLYFGGIRRFLLQHDLHLLVLSMDHDPIYVGPTLFKGFVEKSTWIKDYRGYSFAKAPGDIALGYSKDPVKSAIDTLEELGLTDKVLGMELGEGMNIEMEQVIFDKFRNALPKAKIVDAADLIWKLRGIKSPREIEIIRKLQDITNEMYKLGLETIKDSVNEMELLGAMVEFAMSNGCYASQLDGYIIGRSGQERDSMMGSVFLDKVMKKGDIIKIDGGPCYKDYFSDIIRCASIGEPSDLQKKIYKINQKAFQAVLDEIRPGVKVGVLQAAGQKVVEDAGYGKYWFTFGHVGHNMGLRLVEPPFLRKGGETVLEPGMYLAIETDIYDYPEHKRWFGTGIEDNLLVTKTGYENFTTKLLSRDLTIV